jgi:hypothetical protein
MLILAFASLASAGAASMGRRERKPGCAALLAGGRDRRHAATERGREFTLVPLVRHRNYTEKRSRNLGPVIAPTRGIAPTTQAGASTGSWICDVRPPI